MRDTPSVLFLTHWTVFYKIHPKMTILSRVFFVKSERRFSSSSLTAKEMKNLAKLLSLSWTISRVSNTFSSSSGKQDKSKVFSTLRAKTLTDQTWSTKATVLAVLITSGKPGEMRRCESMNIRTPLMTLNLPVTYARIRPILLFGEYFERPNLFTSAESLKA